MRLTLFASALDRSASIHELAWPDLVARIANPPTYASKSDCPLIKLAVFGNTPSPRGFLRHDANVAAVTGVELDYDGEAVTMQEAAARLRTAGVRCILYTSASHRPEKPRWRVLAPLANEYPPEYRRAYAAYLDGLLGGIAARESYALSQSFYVGRIDGVMYQTHQIDGRCIDELTEAVATPIATGPTVAVPEWRHVPLETLLIDDATRSLIRNGAEQGGRSEALMTAANALAKARMAPDDILRVLSDPSNAISAKALEGRQQGAAMEWLARHTVRKALEAFPPADVVFAGSAIFGPPAKRPALFASAGDLVESDEPIDWQIADVLERGVLGMVFGDPGAGKSFVTLGMAASIATGAPWLGRKVSQGAVAYVAGEGFGGIKRRLKAWSKHSSVTLKGAPLYVSRRAVAFSDPMALGELHGELEALSDRPALIVIDTVARATPGMDENSAKEVGAFIGACDRLREKFSATVLVVHHSGHADKGRAKGSIALKGAVDFEAGVSRSPHDDAVVVLRSTKMKDGEPFAEVHMRFEPVQLPPTRDLQPQSSAVLVAAEAPVKPPKPPTLSKADELLRGIIEAGATEAEAQARFMERYDGSVEAKRSAWRRALQKAIVSGWWSVAVK